MKSSRIESTFKKLFNQKKTALIAFITAGYPNISISENIFSEIPKAGVDIIELGMPFSDPMADGPAKQKSNQVAIKKGVTLKKTLQIVKKFRKRDQKTPIILMGYYNPIFIFGKNKFLIAAKSAGVDGLIVVDLPPENDNELCLPAKKIGISFIRLATPTTDKKRFSSILKNTSGFIYYVSIKGITGTKKPNFVRLKKEVKILKKSTNIPIAVGFGIKNSNDAKKISKFADGVVVGSAITDIIRKNVNKGFSKKNIVTKVSNFTRNIAASMKRK